MSGDLGIEPKEQHPRFDFDCTITWDLHQQYATGQRLSSDNSFAGRDRVIGL
jgi:hypothetical protein